MRAREVIEAESPKAALRAMPPSQFEVDGTWQSWAVDGMGNVLYSMEVSNIPRRAILCSAKRFNVEEYKERNGKWPSRLVPLDQISYWDHWGNYNACDGETQRPRQEAEETWEDPSKYPMDFQVLLFDILQQDFKVKEFPKRVKVKWVPLAPLLQQARRWKYGTGDDRSHKDYQRGISSYVRSGGVIPPLITAGKKLVDGRHRAKALAGHSDRVKVIDLNDRQLFEAEDPKSVLKHVGALERGEGEHKAKAMFTLVARGEHYVLDWHGCITQYSWRNEQSDNVYTFSGQWKFKGMSFHHWANHIVAPWERIRSALVTGEEDSFLGYVWDVDHGSTRQWGGHDAKGKVFISGNWWRMERGAPVAEAEDPKAFLKQHSADARRGFSVRCYMGDWLVDRNGRVLAWGPDTWNGQSAEGDDPAFAAWARSIVKFDFDEWEQHYGQRLPDTIDVCDLGSWTRKGEYVPPEEDWRRDNAEGRI